MAEKVSARSIFEHASCFHHAGAVLRIPEVDFENHIEAYIVVSSFTSELYLKCLFAIESDGQRLPTHDLRKIFDQLSGETRTWVCQRWKTLTEIINSQDLFLDRRIFLPSDLLGELDKCGKIFEWMRYFYEQVDFAEQWLLSPLPDILRSKILQIMPGWAEQAYLVSSEDYPGYFPYPFTMYGLPPR